MERVDAQIVPSVCSVQQRKNRGGVPPLQYWDAIGTYPGLGQTIITVIY
jgi:hypothetical protein